MRVLTALASIAAVVVAGFVLGWALGYVILIALIVAFPILVLVPSQRRKDEPGASGPGTPGYQGRSNVGDEGAR
jgi:hypothetical protein